LELKDHIHLLVDLAPDVSISKLANTMKTVTSREIRTAFDFRRSRCSASGIIKLLIVEWLKFYNWGDANGRGLTPRYCL
jgi:REP element-mobilizing transposase RayT